jgi:hypothetical protein
MESRGESLDFLDVPLTVGKGSSKGGGGTAKGASATSSKASKGGATKKSGGSTTSKVPKGGSTTNQNGGPTSKSSSATKSGTTGNGGGITDKVSATTGKNGASTTGKGTAGSGNGSKSGATSGGKAGTNSGGKASASSGGKGGVPKLKNKPSAGAAASASNSTATTTKKRKRAGSTATAGSAAAVPAADADAEDKHEDGTTSANAGPDPIAVVVSTCPHIHSCPGRTPLLAAFAAALRAKWHRDVVRMGAGAEGMKSRRCKSCYKADRPLWLGEEEDVLICLHCSTPFCRRSSHIHDHLLVNGHTFAVSTESEELYCFDCGDFIYDVSFDLRREQEREQCCRSISLREERLQLSRREEFSYGTKFKEAQTDFSAGSPPLDAARLHVAEHGLFGIYNMGNTCFMSCVLQAILHTPLARSFFLGRGHHPEDCESIRNKVPQLVTEVREEEEKMYLGVVAPPAYVLSGGQQLDLLTLLNLPPSPPQGPYGTLVIRLLQDWHRATARGGVARARARSSAATGPGTDSCGASSSPRRWSCSRICQAMLHCLRAHPPLL